MNINLNNYYKEWIIKVDHHDKHLNAHLRKIKWLAVLGTLFTLYILSFFIPYPPLHHDALVPPKAVPVSDSLMVDSTSLTSSAFELPVDSFEYILKQQIHETTDKK